MGGGHLSGGRSVCSRCAGLSSRPLQRGLAGTVLGVQLQCGCQAACDSSVSERARNATWALSITAGRCAHKGPDRGNGWLDGLCVCVCVRETDRNEEESREAITLHMIN